MPSIVSLTTDFGYSDAYVAAVKGVILSICPEVDLVDVTHEIPPGAIEPAVFITGCAWPYFPPDAIHVVVVDPGVGTDRRAIALRTRSGIFIGPDNGALSAALSDDVRDLARSHDGLATLPPQVEARELTNKAFRRPSPSPTFHGRDIFAPAAAHLARGAPFDQLGPAVHEVVALPPFRAGRLADGTLVGRVMHVDRFGNLITDVRGEDLAGTGVTVELRGTVIAGLARTFAEGHGLLAYVGSAGYLEIAKNGGRAADELRAAPGDAVLVRLS
ncbi:MAG TPA: SAM-dependent chlorinase/fluorinase [Dehalococcoidia bacterium]|nr:SAM-dependent chlorinase/fluorinase [Dehalococcoidia bacterium]